MGGGFGSLGLAGVLAQEAPRSSRAGEVKASPLAPKPPHFPARAKRVIFLFMNGGPSHVDTFDPKPTLTRLHGQKPPAETFKSGRRNTSTLMGSPFAFK